MLSPRAALFIGAAFLVQPAFAQDTPQQVPPPIQASPAPVPAPAVPERVIQMAPAAPVVQSVPSVEEQQRGSNASAAPDEPAPARRTTVTTTRQTTRTAAPARAAAPVRATAPARPVARAPAAEAPATPPAPPPQQTAVPPAAEPAPAPVAEAPAQTSTETTTTNSTTNALPWILGGALVVLAALAGLLLLGRRRNAQVETVYDEPAMVEPALDEAVLVPAPEPRGRQPYVAVMTPPARVPDAAPARAVETHEEIEVARAESEDLAGVADARAPVANRPWLEFGLRPVRAGTSEEEALVDVELTVGNAGDTPARDVRISTFMLADADATEMESLLTEHRDGTNAPPVTIPPGDGTRVDAHLAVPKGELGRTFNPVVVAEARYTLPDGSEGHTQAAFRIGRPAPSEAGVGPIGATRPHMIEDLEAELLGAPERA